MFWNTIAAVTPGTLYPQQRSNCQPGHADCPGFDDDYASLSLRRPGHTKQRLPGQNAVISPAQKENIQTLLTDLKVIQAKSDVSAEQKETLVAGMKTLLMDLQAPDKGTLQAFAADLSEAVSDGAVSPTEAIALGQALQQVMTEAGISEEALKTVKADLQEIIAASNVTQEDVQTILADLEAIARTAADRRAGRPERPVGMRVALP